jgi:hypothetical protein
VDQAKLVELVAEEELSIEVVCESDGRVLAIVKRKLGVRGNGLVSITSFRSRTMDAARP